MTVLHETSEIFFKTEFARVFKNYVDFTSNLHPLISHLGFEADMFAMSNAPYL